MTVSCEQLFPKQCRALRILADQPGIHALVIAGAIGGGQDSLADWLIQQWIPTVGTAPHPDMYTITRNPGQQVITVAQIRRGIAHLHAHPQIATQRLLIIRQVEFLNQAASNALLKTLEDAPTAARIILTTAAVEQLLPTIRSRVACIAVPPLADSMITQLIRPGDDSAGVTRSIHGRYDRLEAYDRNAPAWEQWQTERGFWIAFLKGSVPERQALVDEQFLQGKQTAAALHGLPEQLQTLVEIIYRSWLAERQKNGILTAQATTLRRLLSTVTQAQKQLQQNTNKKMILDYLVFAL